MKIGASTVTAIFLGTTAITSAYLGTTQVFGGSAFSPSSLFASSEPGVWYDPSDLTTLFQDTAGTVAVTTPGQTVARMNDKSGRGNNATQATAASRPTYGVVPLGGRRNILLATDTMATQTRAVTAAAHTLAFTGTGTVTLTGVSTAGPLVGTGVSNRVSLTFTPTAGNLTLTVSGSVTLAQLELGSTATAYQKVTTAFDVTEAGVQSLAYLSFDGVDDFMLTGTITPGVDKAQIFAGVRKLSDATVGFIAEMSVTVASNNGSFSIAMPRQSGEASVVSDLRGSSGAFRYYTGVAAPISLVVSALYDIGGSTVAEELLLRNNGAAQSGTSGGPAGTGNFLAYPLYIARRAGTSFPLNGQIYSLITRFGANLTAGQITDTETWVNGKTGAYT
jgi:hypothetical protein